MHTTDPSTSASDADSIKYDPQFRTTHWSVVLSASGNDTSKARVALDQLCRNYWYPLYVFVRRQGQPVEDAKDLTQEFFCRVLEGDWLAQADPARGRFRTFLLVALKRFMANEWRKAGAQRRGGHAQLVPLELETAETRLGSQPATTNTPEQIFERAWAMSVLQQALQGLRAEYARAGQAELFEKLRPTLLGERDSQPYASLARQLSLSEGAVKVAVHRLRQRYRQQLRNAVAQTVVSPEEVEAEMRYLFRIVTGA